MQVSHLAQTKQGQIEYRSVGRGQAVLVLNGGHTNCHSPLGHEAFFLAQGYQLIAPSRPGYGRTPSSTGKTAEAFAEALVSLLDALRLDQVIVVGISAGGPTALQLAGRHPERVSKVILQNAVRSHKAGCCSPGREIFQTALSTIAFKVSTPNPGDVFILENTFLAKGGTPVTCTTTRRNGSISSKARSS